MLIVLKKRYTLSVEISEGNDEFWDEVRAKGITGADEVLQTIKDALANLGFTEPGCSVRLTKFEER